MATFPSFNFPSQRTVASGSFAPAQVDFSQIGKLYDSYTDAQNNRMKQDAFREQQEVQRGERARQDQIRSVFSEGIPRDAQGNPDYAAMSERLMALDPNQGVSFLKIGMSQQPKPTDDQREYAQAKQQGYGGSFMDYMRDVKSFGASRTNINMPKMETKYDETLGAELAKEFVNANRSAATAQRDLANLDVMMQALNDPNLYTGTGGNLIQGVKKSAETLFGVPVKGTSSGEILQNLASEIAVANKDKLPGPMSDADRQFLVDMAPNLTKTPEGNRLIIELGAAHKRWEAARGQAARDYAARNGGRLDAGFYATVGDLDSQAGQEFSTFVGRMRGLGQLAPRPPTVGVPNAYKQKYGLE